MNDEDSLAAAYLLLIDAELVRIAFTEDDFRYLASGGQLTEESLDRDPSRTSHGSQIDEMGSEQQSRRWGNSSVSIRPVECVRASGAVVRVTP